MSWILLATVFLAFANGANDNFKGVATLVGSGTWGRRRALGWATLMTFLGSMVAIVLAGELLARFGGKGLVGPEVTADPAFAVAVAMGAAGTVLLATRLGMPTSTTHSIIGALVGAGLVAGGSMHFGVLGRSFVLPLLASPFLAMFGTMALYPAFRAARRRIGVGRESCFCVGGETVAVVPALAPAEAVAYRETLSIRTGQTVSCREHYTGRLFGLNAGVTLDTLHVLSAGAMSFARGLNDTPKIAALMLVIPAFGGRSAIVLCGVAIALGGLLASRGVGHTMSHKITPMNAGQGFTSNIVTTVLVLAASPFGLPVSTTHVSNGALFGLGLVRGGANGRTIARILLTWVVTLPLAGLLAAGVLLVSSST